MNSTTIREVNHTGMQPLKFEAFEFTVKAKNDNRKEAKPFEAFKTYNEAEAYAFECADADKGHQYDVMRVSDRKIMATVAIASN